MKRFLACVLAAIILSAAPLRAQRNPEIDRLAALSHAGQLAQLIQSANAILAQGRLTDTDRGIALTYLGHGYQNTGNFPQAIASYERALTLINRDGLHTHDYATILAALATLYAETGQPDTAKHLLLRSIGLFQQQNDHTGAAIIYNDLATIAADQRSHRDAHKYITLALAESQLATNFRPDQFSALTCTQGRIAQLDHDPATAIADYQRALTLWKQLHADQQPETAWLYVLLGGAYLQSGDLDRARETTLHGLNALESTTGPQSPRYFEAELIYSKILAASGSTTEAATLRASAESALATISRPTQTTISIAALH